MRPIRPRRSGNEDCLDGLGTAAAPEKVLAGGGVWMAMNETSGALAHVPTGEYEEDPRTPRGPE